MSLGPSSSRIVFLIRGPRIFLHDRNTNQTTHVPATAGGTEPDYLQLSADGLQVGFQSGSSIFVHNRRTNRTTRIPGNHQSVFTALEGRPGFIIPWKTADGRYTVVVSGGNTSTISIHDRRTNQTTLLPVGLNGAQSNSGSHAPRITSNGRFVVFHSAADNLVPRDTNQATDIFVVEVPRPAQERELRDPPPGRYRK